MSISQLEEEGNRKWCEFLEKWPIDNLKDMSLKKYANAGDKDTFTYWLEFGTEVLGSIKGGSAYKLGVYSRRNKKEKKDRKGLSYDDNYGWMAKYGNTSEEAFDNVRSIINNIAQNATQGLLKEIDDIDFVETVKWKIAFLYQNRENPVVLPVFASSYLRDVLQEKNQQLSCSELHKKLMDQRHDKGLFDYTDELLTKRKEILEKKNKPESPSDAENIHEPNRNQSSPPTENTIPLNQILYGPPGTGKTFKTINKALAILDLDFLSNHSSKSKEDREALKKRFDEFLKSENISFVTFHQSFSYEDFVEGLRPVPDNTEGMTYEVVAGVFKKLCAKAKEDATKPCVIIIDEINRGNISRIFGELITLIEDNKRAGELEALEVILPYSKDKDNKFSIPRNVYIIGTMNSADRSLTGVDIALRRRFSFVEMPPDPDLLKDKDDNYINVKGIDIYKLLKVMNERIEVLFDRDHCLGHSYFMSLNNDSTVEDLGLIFKDKILPLLREYFFDDWERIRWVLNDHRKEEKYQFLQTSMGKNTTDFTEISQLFGKEISGKLPDRRWRINQPAFWEIDSYRGILNPDKSEHNSGVPE
jgi:5-methylcytosine-specific restriction enzyme B